MQMHVPPIDPEIINELAEKVVRDKAEVEAMRPKTTWLARMGEQLLHENHLSDRIRRALGE
jgi:DNA topoisomerase VI subunit B